MCVLRKASFSRCKQYRYSLSRHWNVGQGRCVFIGLNPSTADASADDPTIRRCMGFARDWGYREMIMVNLFAFRTPHPQLLKAATDPEGAQNRRALKRNCISAERIVAAWGNHGTYQNQDSRMAVIWQGLSVHCFGLTKTGQPLHPLYQARTASLIEFAQK